MYVDDLTALKWTCKNSNQVEMQVFEEPVSEQDCSTAPVPSYKLLVSHGTRYELVGGQIDEKVAVIVGMSTKAFEIRFRKSTCNTHTTTIPEKCLRQLIVQTRKWRHVRQKQERKAQLLQ